MRPLIVPQPVTTPSPGMRFFSAPKSVLRCSTNMSNSSKESGSSSSSRRSRAVSLPRACWASMRASAAAQTRALRGALRVRRGCASWKSSVAGNGGNRAGECGAAGGGVKLATERSARERACRKRSTAGQFGRSRSSRAWASASSPHCSAWKASSRVARRKASGRRAGPRPAPAPAPASPGSRTRPKAP